MPGGRQLQLSQRSNFFTDPFFSDILKTDDADLRKRLDLFKSSALTKNKSDAEPHNLQVTASNDLFLVQLELPGFAPEEFSLKTKSGSIILEAKHRGKADGGKEITERFYTKEFRMPEGVQSDQIKSSYSAAGILTIEAPRVLTAPDGATVQEAMAAKSKAFTTDDGKTAVKEDSQASSQVIAATTESPDGLTKSSMTYTSSNSSSSSMMTTSSGGTIPGLDMGAFNMQMPSLGGGPAGSLDMDGMMKKMMADMSMGGGVGGSGSLASKFAGGIGSDMMKKSSFSSSMESSSSQQQQQSSSAATSSKSTVMDQANRMGMMSPPLNIEELSNAGSDIGGRLDDYTVTSPPPSVHGGDSSTLNHTVKPTSDFHQTVNGDPQADHTVLLKLREGDEYKLVLNMQSYKPENITVKLNDERELTVSAHAGGGKTNKSNVENFVQRHMVPAGIDTDQMTSSFSADGILVIRAPRMKKK